MKAFFHKIFTNGAKIFSGYNLFWHLLAIALTYAIVTTDFDWKYYLLTRPVPAVYFFPALGVGGLLPMVLPFILLAIGKVKKSLASLAAAYTLGQAALLGWLVSAIYKTFTGRVPPEFFHNAMLSDISQQFRFGILRGGVFWGWPSSHTTVAFAMAVSLICLFPRRLSVKILSLLYAVYIGLAVSISMHWFSEFVAGAIFGSVVGMVVGKSYYQKYFNLH